MLSKNTLLEFVCLPALVMPLLVAPAIARAQDSSAPNADGGSDENIITVSGRRLDAQLSIEAKRDADQIVDVLTADEASKLPDNNIAESLSRITGVSVIRSGETGDGNFISVRGLDSALVNVQFDGVTGGTANGGNRSVPLEGLSADNIAEIRVSKSLLPSDEGVGVGGAVKIISKTPLNGGKDRITFDASGRYHEFADRMGYDVGGSFTKIFSDSFGVTFSASYRQRYIQNLEIDSSSSHISGLSGIVDAAGNTLSPQEIIDLGLDDAGTSFDDIRSGLIPISAIVFEDQSYQLQQQRRDRLTLSGAIDWRPSDTTLITLGGRYSREKTLANEYSITFDEDDRDFFVQDGLLVSEFSDAEIDVEGQIEDQISINANAYLKGITETGRFKFEYLLSYARAEEDEPQTDIFFDTDGLIDDDPLHPYTFVNRYFPVPSINSDNFAEAISDIAGTQNLDFFETDLINRNTNDRYAARLDVTYDVGSDFLGGALTSVQVGAKYERSDIREDSSTILDGDPEFINSDGSFNEDEEGTAEDFTLGDFAGLFAGTDNNSLSFVGSPLSGIGLNGIPTLNRDAFIALRDTFQETYTGDLETLFFDAREETYAGYFQANMEVGNLQMSGGLRVEHYEGRFAAPLELGANLSLVDADGQRSIRLSPTTTLETVNSAAENTEILPRLNGRYLVSEDFQIRFGAGYSIARPTFSQLGRATEVSIGLEADAGLGTILPGVTDAAGAVAAGGLDLDQITEAGIFVFSGNPNLDNARSLNLDLSFEYYPRRGTAITLGLFHKRIENFIFLSVESGSGTLEADVIQSLLTADGQSLIAGLGGLDGIVANGANTDISIAQPTNGDLAKISGIEFGISHQLDYLPGFLSHIGASANLTYTDSDASYVVVPGASALNPDGGLQDDEAEVVLGYSDEGDALIRQTSFFRSPEITANATIFYEDDDLDIALSASYQTESFASTDDYGLDQFTAAYFQLDLFVGYTLPLPENYGEFKVFFEVPDVTDGGRKAVDLQTAGRSRTAFDEASFNGREVRFGIRGKF